MERFKSSGKLFGGYDFTENWGVEAGYTDFRSTAYTWGDGFKGSFRGGSMYLAGKATMPVGERFGLFAKLGVAHNRRRVDQGIFFSEDTTTGGYASVGAEYKLNEKVALSLEYERYRKDVHEMGASVWTAGAKYAFW